MLISVACIWRGDDYGTPTSSHSIESGLPGRRASACIRRIPMPLDGLLRLWTIVRYVPNQNAELDRVFGALSNTARRRIVARLVRSPATVGELAEPLAMALPSVLQHLQVLQDCGLVTTHKTGRVRTCAIEPAVLRTAEAWLVAQRTVWETRLADLGDYLGGRSDDTPTSGRTTS